MEEPAENSCSYGFAIEREQFYFPKQRDLFLMEIHPNYITDNVGLFVFSRCSEFCEFDLKKFFKSDWFSVC